MAKQRESFERQQEDFGTRTASSASAIGRASARARAHASASASTEHSRSLGRSSLLGGSLHRCHTSGTEWIEESSKSGKAVRAATVETPPAYQRRELSQTATAETPQASVMEHLRFLNQPGASGALQIQLTLGSSQRSAGHSLSSLLPAPTTLPQKQNSLSQPFTTSLPFPPLGPGDASKRHPSRAPGRGTRAPRGNGQRPQRSGQRLATRSLSVGAGGPSKGSAATATAASLLPLRARGARPTGTPLAGAPDRTSLRVQEIPLSFSLRERREEDEGTGEEERGVGGQEQCPGREEEGSVSFSQNSAEHQEASSLLGAGLQESSWSLGPHREGRPLALTSLRFPPAPAVPCSLGRASMPRLHAHEAQWGRGDLGPGIGEEARGLERGGEGAVIHSEEGWHREGEENGVHSGVEWASARRHQGVLPSAAKRRALTELLNRLHTSDAEPLSLPAEHLQQGRGKRQGQGQGQKGQLQEQEPVVTRRLDEQVMGAAPAPWAPHCVSGSQPWGSGLSPSLSMEWEQGVAEEGAELGHSLRDYAEAASKEHMSQSVFEAQLLLAEQESESAGGGSGRGSQRQHERTAWAFPSSGSGHGKRRGKQTRCKPTASLLVPTFFFFPSLQLSSQSPFVPAADERLAWGSAPEGKAGCGGMAWFH